jgi:hypothetical protein
MAILQVKINKEIIFLNDWRKTSVYTENRIRETLPLIDDLDEEEYIVLKCLLFETNIWCPMFIGPKLHILGNAYEQMYPAPPIYINLEKAQDHIDKFIEQFNSLKAFL